MRKLADFDARALLAFAESTLLERRKLEVDDLAAGAHWAVLHAMDPTSGPDGRRRRGGPRLVQVGGEGTPKVQDLCLAELALSRQTHALATRWLVADALDLIHRLPRCWAVVIALECEVWVARKLARSTRHLSAAEAAQVDAAVATALAGEQPGRFFTILEAKIIEANPELHAERISAERARRYVSLGRVDEAGLRHVIARVEHGDAVWVDALIGRVAEILAARDAAAGDPARDRDTLRSVAFGWLARPAELLALLLEHSGDLDVPPDPHPDDIVGQPDDTVGNPDGTCGDSDDPVGDSDGACGDSGEPAGDSSDTGGRPDGVVGDPGDTGGKPGDVVRDPGDSGVDPDAEPGAAYCDPVDADQPSGSVPDVPDVPEAPEAGWDWVRGFPARMLASLRSVEPAKLRPRAIVYVHLHQAALEAHASGPHASGPGAPEPPGAPGVARVEAGGGPRLYQHLADLLDTAQITVTPVLDLEDRVSTNAYEFPEAVRERIHLITPAEPFPHSTRISRKGDMDHVVPYDPPSRAAAQTAQTAQTGQAGQTGTHNGAPLGRYAHRVKTHAQYTVREPRPGTYAWRTPHDRYFLVDHDGTRRVKESLGRALVSDDGLDRSLALLLIDRIPDYGNWRGPNSEQEDPALQIYDVDLDEELDETEPILLPPVLTRGSTAVRWTPPPAC